MDVEWSWSPRIAKASAWSSCRFLSAYFHWRVGPYRKVSVRVNVPRALSYICLCHIFTCGEPSCRNTQLPHAVFQSAGTGDTEEHMCLCPAPPFFKERCMGMGEGLWERFTGNISGCSPAYGNHSCRETLLCQWVIIYGLLQWFFSPALSLSLCLTLQRWTWGLFKHP